MEEYLFNKEDNSNYFLLRQNEPTIVIGKNQNTIEEINSEYVKEKGIHIVRRITGGGAVYHDLGNLNYTFIIKDNRENCYDFKRFTLPIIKALELLGIHPELSGRNDLVIDGKKFSGNAQYINNGKLLHHGTLLFNSKLEELNMALKVSKDKFESKGIKSVRARVTNIKDYLSQCIEISQFKEIILKHMFKENDDLKEGSLSKNDVQNINRLMDEKYKKWDWNYGKSPEFNLEKSERFESGNIKVLMNIKAGYIKGIKFYGDFFGNESPEKLENVLLGKRLTEKDIRQALENFNIDEYFKGFTVNHLVKLFFK